MGSRKLEEVRLSRRQLLALAGAFAAACARDGSNASDSPVDGALLEPDYPDNDLLAGPDWLRRQLDEPELRLLDLSGLPGYRDSHIPGALHVWWQDLIEINNPVYGMQVGPQGRQDVVQKAGIDPDSTVVCYDRSGGVYASRMIWVLRYMGFTNARLLVGGLQGWRESGGELSSSPVEVQPSGGINDIGNEPINSHADDIMARRGEPGLALLDTRTDAERDESWRGLLRKGQIPGSFHLSRDRFIDAVPVPVVVAPETLRARLLDAGIDLDATTEIIVYGLHATLASLPWLVLTALGGPHIRLYDGSWAEWSARDDLPLEGSLRD